jgi:hypothetical protein
MARIVKLLAAASGSALVSVIAASPALAGSPVPGPVVGAGLPALAVIAGGYYLIRRRRRQS